MIKAKAPEQATGFKTSSFTSLSRGFFSHKNDKNNIYFLILLEA